MKAGWEVKPLGEVCEIKGGKRVPKGSKLQAVPTPYPYVSVSDFTADGTVSVSKLKYISEDIHTQIERYVISSNDIYFSIAGTIGKTGSVPKELDGANLTENACKLVLGDRLEKRFLYYSTLSVQFVDQVKLKTRTTAQPKLSLERLKSISIPLPPLEEQKRIVAVLDGAFDALTRARAHVEANLLNARELFESGLDAAFDTGSDEWRLSTFGDESILRIVDGDRGANYPKNADFSGIGYCLFLNTKNVRPDGFNFENCMFISQAKDEALRKGKLRPRDVILTTRGTIGNIAIFDETVSHSEIRINSGMLILRPNETKITSEYLFEVLRSRHVKTQIKEKTSGAAQPQLPINTLVTISMPVPKSTTLQKKIVYGLKELAAKTSSLEAHYHQKLSDLDDLRQSLLQKAFAGELT